MPEIDIKVTNTSADQVKEILALVKRLAGFGKALTLLTKTTADDKALEVIEKIIAVVEPLVDNPGFADLLDLLLGLFKKDPKLAVEKVKQALEG